MQGKASPYLSDAARTKTKCRLASEGLGRFDFLTLLLTALVKSVYLTFLVLPVSAEVAAATCFRFGDRPVGFTAGAAAGSAAELSGSTFGPKVCW